MRYIDLAIQTLLFIITIVLLVLTYGEADWPLAILVAQMYIGPWQILSSLVSTVRRANLWKLKRTHLVISCAYLIILYACANSTLAQLQPSEIIFKILITVPAWALAMYHYVITWNATFPKKRNRGSFLPNLSF